MSLVVEFSTPWAYPSHFKTRAIFLCRSDFVQSVWSLTLFVLFKRFNVFFEIQKMTFYVFLGCDTRFLEHRVCARLTVWRVHGLAWHDASNAVVSYAIIACNNCTWNHSLIVYRSRQSVRYRSTPVVQYRVTRVRRSVTAACLWSVHRVSSSNVDSRTA